MKLGLKIKAARELMGLTQNDLVKKSGVSRASIQLYEADKGNITLENLEKIANALDFEIGDFFVPQYLPFNQKNVPQMSPNMSISDSPTSADMIAVPFFKDNTASAGFGVMNFGTEVAHIPLSKPFLLEVCGVASLKGLSMLKCSGE